MINNKIIRINLFIIICISFFLMPFHAISGNIIIQKEGKNNISIIENSWSDLVFSNKISNFSFSEILTEEGNFTRLIVEGYGRSFKHGHPELPVMYKLIEIPIGGEYKITHVKSNWIDIDLKSQGINNYIYPVQPPVAKSYIGEIPFVVNQEAYRTDGFIPSELVSIEDKGMMRGLRLARLALSPFSYNPVAGTLRVYYDIEISISFKNADILKTEELKQLNSSPYFSFSEKHIFNYKPVNVTKENITTYPVKYVIVSPVAYQATLQPFVEWKTKKGFQVIEAYTNDPLVGTTNVSIKNYLKNLYNAGTPSDPPPSYILLVGDIDQVPSFNGTTHSHVTDLPYGEYTNDFLPEVYYGRFSCTGISDLQPQIDKTLEYEQYLMPDDSFLNEVVLVSGYDAAMAPTYGNGQINYGTSTYFNSSNGLNSHTYLHPASQNQAAQIKQDIGNGCAFANYTAHGSSNGWADPSFTVSDVQNMQNNNKYPLMIGNACVTNKFNEPVCFGEALLRAAGKGALGYIGASNNTYWYEDYYWSVGAKPVVVNPSYDANALGAYDRLFHTHGEAFEEWYVTQAQIMFAGNLAVAELSSSDDYYWEIYHLMGDPSLMVYFSVPPQLNCTYNPLIILGANSFTVNTEPYAYVALSMNGVLHGAALADASGIAQINITPFTNAGSVDVIATRQNRKPFFGTVAAASPTGPYVILTSKTVNDASSNNNGIPEANENILLSVSLQNFGANTSTSTSATLTTTDTYINITDNYELYGDITSGGTVTKSDAFAFTVAGNIPDKHIINFILNISDNASNSWSSPFSITAHAPSLFADNLIIDDFLGGNGNNRLDPGETIVIIIKTENKGMADALAVTGTLSSSNPNITVNTLSSNIGNISSGGFGFAVFNITVSNSAVAGDLADLIFNASSGQYTVQKTFLTMIGIIHEDWETGDFNKFSWVLGGSLPWTISSLLPFEGTYSAQSGAINHLESSSLLINLNVTTDDTISFYRKVSSESGYDFLKFYIDNNEKKSWSGTVNWGREAFPIAAGARTLKWEYVKDYSMTSGSDCAWIDFIMFPPCSFPTSIESNFNSNTASFNVYPNPVNNVGIIELTLEESSYVDISIYSLSGQKIKNITTNSLQKPGNQTYYFDATTYVNGMYYIVLQTEKQLITKKLIINN